MSRGTRDDKSHSPLRSALKNNPTPGRAGNCRRDLNDQFSKNEKVEQLKRQLMDLQSENDRLSHQVQTMVGNYKHQIDSKDEAIRALRERIADATTSCKDASEVE